MGTTGLYRTNVKLTGNIKISVSSKDEIFLNSIDANKDLSDDRFKKVKVNPNSRLSTDFYKFFDKGKLSSNLIYDIFRTTDDLSSKQNFIKHYEQQYNYGVSRCNSNLFDEKYSMFAPLWLTDQIPNFFIIFRNPDARNIQYERNPTKLIAGRRYTVFGRGFNVTHGGITYSSGDSFVAGIGGFYARSIGEGYVVLDDPEYEYNYITDPDNLIKNFISPSDIVAIFDLREDTKIGKYLRNHINDPLFSTKSIEVDFDNDQLVYHGIDITTGIISSAIESLDTITEKELDIIDFDEFITAGFERHKFASSNLLNFEFMFDDAKSDDYTFNRYHGFYCDDIDVGDFFIDKPEMFSKKGLYRNVYHDKNVLPKYYGSKIEDDNGIKIIPDKITDSKGYIFTKDEIKEKPTVYYLKDKRDGMHKFNNVLTDEHYTLMDKEIDSELLFGFTDEHFELSSKALTEGGKSSIIFTVNEQLQTGYKIQFFQGDMSLGFIIADDLLDVTPQHLQELEEGTYSGDPTTSYQEGESVGYFFYPTGTFEQIAQGMATAIDYLLKDKRIDATAINNRIILKAGFIGSGYNKFRIDAQGSEVTFSSTKFIGGSTVATSRVRVDKDLPLDITEDSFMSVDDGFVKIASISPYLDEPVFSEGNIIGFNGIDSYKVITIVDENKKIRIEKGDTSVFNEQQLKIGVLSFYDIKDFDFDFFTSSYTKTYSNEYKKYFKTAKDKLIVGDIYTVYKLDNDQVTAIIEHDGIQYADTTSFTAVDENFTIITGDPIVINDKYYDDEELKKFIGFNTLITDEVQKFNIIKIDPDDLKNKFDLFSTDETKVEYNRLKENQKSKNALKSKIIPIINKWVLENGNNIRDIDYKLNISDAFGKLNFTPSFLDENQDTSFFTHEWLYLASLPENISDEDLIDSTSYFDSGYNIEKLKDEQSDYFEKYFVIDGYVLEETPDNRFLEAPTQKRYTTFEKMSDENFQTFFRGAKIKLFSESIDYSGYKFSAILNFKKTEFLVNRSPFEITVIENRDFKNITFVVDIIIDDYKVVPDLGKEPYGEYMFLYMMKSLKRYVPSNYLYGIEFDYPSTAPVELFNSVAGVPVPPPILKFRGNQLYQKTNMENLPNVNTIKYDNNRFLLTDFFKVDIDGKFGRLIGLDSSGVIMITSTNPDYSSSQYVIDRPNTILGIGSKENEVQLENTGFSIVQIPSTISVGSYTAHAVHSGIYPLDDLIWFEENGGLGVYEKVADLLSFGKMADIINSNDERYVSYKVIENGLIDDNTDFGLKFVKPSKINRDVMHRVEKVNILKKELPNENIIDYESVEFDRSSTYHRYGGNFIPKFKNVLHFKNDKLKMSWGLYDKTWNDADHNWNEFDVQDPETKTIPFSRRLFDLNTKFDTTVENFGVIKNLFHHKVSSSNPDLLALADPIFPSIGEIGIDKINHNIFLSDFDAKFYKNYIDKNKYRSIYGYFSMIDIKSFMGTKLLQLEDKIILSDFNNIEEGERINNPKFDMEDKGLVYEIKKDAILFRISLEKILIEYVFNKISGEFKKFVNEFNTSNGNFDEAIRTYISNNIINLYRTDTVVPFVKKYNEEDGIPLINTESNELLLFEQGYRVDKNISTRKFSELEMVMRYNTKEEFQYSFSIHTTVII